MTTPSSQSSDPKSFRLLARHLVGISAPIFLLISVAISFFAASNMQKTSIEVAHSNEVIRSLENILSLLKDAETGQRGYLISGDLPYLEPYESALHGIDLEMTHLEILTRDNVEQQSNFLALKNRVTTRLRLLKDRILIFQNKGFEAVRLKILSGEGRAAMDVVRTQIAVMQAAERSLLAEREGRTRRAFILSAASGVLTSLITIFLLALIARLMAKRVAAESQAAQEKIWLSTTLASIGDAVIATDSQARIRFMNKSAESITGWTEDEARGAPLETVFKIVNDESHLTVENPALHALEDGRIEKLAKNTSLISRSGKHCPIDDSAAPIRNEVGDIIGTVLVFRDITQRKEAEAKQLATQEQVIMTLESITDGFMRVDRDWRVVYVNAEAVQTNQLTRADMMGKTLWELFPAVVGTKLESEYRRAVADHVTVELDNFYEPFGRWFAVKGFPSLDGGLAIYFRDITEWKLAEKAARKNEERYRAATVAVNAIIWTNDAAGLMEGKQLGWGKFTGQSREEYEGHGWLKAVHPEDAQRTIDEWNRTVAEKRTFVLEHRIRRHDGLWRDCAIRAVPILNVDGKIQEWVGVHTDITERKADEEKLRRLAAELSEADRRKDEFLAMLAHELRNPLNAICSGVSLLRRAYSSDEKLRVINDAVNRQTKHMVRLIDDLLEVSRITSGKIKLRLGPLDIETFISSAVDSARPLIDDKKHTLEINLPKEHLFVEGDSARLSQVVANLLGNSAKYTKRGGNIWLNVEQQESKVLIRVRDTGVGIPKDMLPKVFNLFTQIDSSLDRSQGGLGIGLAIVSRIAEMHEGKVEAFSEGEGKGSEFVVTLPVLALAPKEEEEVHDNKMTLPLPSRRVLVVDDSEDSVQMLSMLLVDMRHEVRTAHDGPSALKLVESFTPEVVFLDIGLPGLNGFQIAAKFRESVTLKNVVLVALTGYGDEKHKQMVKEAGFDHHVVKPIDLDRLEGGFEGLFAILKHK